MKLVGDFGQLAAQQFRKEVTVGSLQSVYFRAFNLSLFQLSRL
jgi:hypothetical protein